MAYPLTPEQLKERRRQLPDKVREIYSSIETTEILQSIGQQQGLHIDQIGELVDETGLVMLGVTHPSDYIGNLKKRLDVDTDTAKAIAKAVNAEVFEQIRAELRNLHSKDSAPSEMPGPRKTPESAKQSEPQEKREAHRSLKDALPKQPAETGIPADSSAGGVRRKAAAVQEKQKESAQPEEIRTEKPHEVRVPENLPTGPADFAKTSETKAPAQEAAQEEAHTEPLQEDQPAETTEPLNREQILKEIEGAEQSDEAGLLQDSQTTEGRSREYAEDTSGRQEEAQAATEEPRKPAREETAPQESLAEKKLRSSVTLPREESTYLTEPRESTKTPEERPVHKDPYREPIE